jgi:hypothetical protein
VRVFWFRFRYVLNSNTSLSMYLFCNSRTHVITLYSGHIYVYYASTLRYWHLVWILVRTDHPCLGMGWYSLSRRWRAGQVSYEIHNQASSRSTRFGPPKVRISFQCPSCPKQFSTVTWLQKAVATKPCIGIGHMSNRRESVFINGIFCIQSFWEGHSKFSPRSALVPKGTIHLDFPRYSNPTDFR